MFTCAHCGSALTSDIVNYGSDPSYPMCDACLCDMVEDMADEEEAVEYVNEEPLLAWDIDDIKKLMNDEMTVDEYAKKHTLGGYTCGLCGGRVLAGSITCFACGAESPPRGNKYEVK